MNAEPGKDGPARPVAKARPPALLDAIDACFSSELPARSFPERFARLAAEITTAPQSFVFRADDQDVQVLASATGQRADDAARDLAGAILSKSERAGAELRLERPWLAARIALPGGGDGAAVIALPGSGAALQSLAYERLALLASLSHRQFRHGELEGFTQLVQDAAGVANGDPARAQSLVDTLSRVSGADFAAMGRFDGRSIGAVTISGQSVKAKRASLPEELRREMKETALRDIRSAERAFAPYAGGNGGIVLHVSAPQKNRGMLQLATAALSLASPRPARRRFGRAALLRTVAILLVIGGVAMVPIPDTIEIPATVQATDRRIVTAPFSGKIKAVNVQNNETVEAGASALVAMDTQEFDIELISARSEYSAAVLERESARATRDAAKLTNAELEAERLRARIDLLEFKKASADLGAPIAGIVSAPGLAEREGSTVNQGDTLFEISDPASFMLDLAIPQEVVGRIEEPATGRFRPDYDPTIRVDSAITLVSPALSTQHEIPVFLGEATLESAAALRPGMRGVLAIEQPFQPVWFIVWRAVRNWVLLRLWF